MRDKIIYRSKHPLAADSTRASAGMDPGASIGDGIIIVKLSDNACTLKDGERI